MTKPNFLTIGEHGLSKIERDKLTIFTSSNKIFINPIRPGLSDPQNVRHLLVIINFLDFRLRRELNISYILES